MRLVLALLALVPLFLAVPVQHATSTPMIVAHRGSSGVAPENTLASFKLALEQKAAALETDAHLTKDGFIVLIHDDTLQRTTNGSGRIVDFTLAELETLDAGSWKGKEYANERIPTLTNLMDLIVSETSYQPDIVLDLKNDSPAVLEKITEVLKPYVSSGKISARRIILGSWGYEQAVQIKQLMPDATLMLITSLVPIPLFFGKWLDLGLNIVSVNFQALSLCKHFVSYGHEHNIQTFVWTLDTSDEKIKVECMQASGMDVDGIVTDFPIQPSAESASPFSETVALQWALDACKMSLRVSHAEYELAATLAKSPSCIGARAIRCDSPTSKICADLARAISAELLL